jgi:hypothetical protein
MSAGYIVRPCRKKKKNVIHTHTWTHKMVHSPVLKEGDPAICNNMDEGIVENKLSQTLKE